MQMVYIRVVNIGQIQFDGLCNFLFLGINNLCVYLSCTYISMSKHLADRVNVSTTGKLQGCIGVSKTVEGYVFGDSSRFYPFLYGAIYP